MAGNSPLLALGKDFHRSHPEVDFPVLATQLSLLPNLRYLQDGLRRSRLAIARHGNELGECLRAVPGNRFEPDGLLIAIDTLLRWIEEQEWSEDDHRRWIMTGDEGSTRHPLAGYCLSTCFLWPNLFYAPEPLAGDGEIAPQVVDQYADLMGEFSVYVIAAQSTMDPSTYMGFCEQWWRSNHLPSLKPYRDQRLRSRLEKASLVMRRMTLREYRELLLALVCDANAMPLHERISLALNSSWADHERKALTELTRLLEDVRLGWRRPDAKSALASDKQRGTSTRVTQKNLRDGYLRLPEQHAMSMTEVSTDGWKVMSVMPQPATLKTLTQELLLAKEAEAISQLVEDDSEGEAELADIDLAALREQAGIEAEREIDGLEWMPVEESAGAEAIESILLDEVAGESESTAPPKSSSIAAHIRRFRYGHDLTKDRLTFREANRILCALMGEPSDSPAREALVALHASIALGRPLESLRDLEVREDERSDQDRKGSIRYVLNKKRWVLPAPPAAWADLARTHDERPQWSQMWLNDHTGFAELLAHFGLAKPGSLFQNFTEPRKRGVTDFLRRALPRTEATTTQCAKFLHRELLTVNDGDLGLAALITGHLHGHAASVAHYAHYRASTMSDVYRRVWVRDRPHPENNGEGKPENNPVHGYGALRVPTVESVARKLEHLRDRVRHGSHRERHNAFTAYTLASLVLGTAMRPVVSLDLDLPAQVRGLPAMLSFVDKARTDYHRRVVAIPRTLEAHLRSYLRYLLARGLTRENASFPLIYIDPETGDPERFRPSHAVGLTTPAFELEIYALRRFVRTHLREVHRVAGEDLDAWMGHWLHRVSPHDFLSTYPMRRLCDLAEGPVEQMLVEVGFVPLKGPTWQD
ncbi:MAG: hypothetical protein KGI42_09390 [Xanthomonadaceae bacterium]|nr:hypothetical protein [Xanthomonadaceae bacterium]